MCLAYLPTYYFVIRDSNGIYTGVGESVRIFFIRFYFLFDYLVIFTWEKQRIENGIRNRNRIAIKCKRCWKMYIWCNSRYLKHVEVNIFGLFHSFIIFVNTSECLKLLQKWFVFYHPCSHTTTIYIGIYICSKANSNCWSDKLIRNMVLAITKLWVWIFFQSG